MKWWKDSIFKGFRSNISQPNQWKKIEELFIKLGKSYSEVDLFRYWINNVFKIKENE